MPRGPRLMARLVWSPTACRCLAEIVEYVARDSPDAALRVHRALLRGVRRVGAWPMSCSWVGARYPALSSLDRSCRVLVVRPYLVFCRIRDADVLILTVQHGAQLPPPAETLEPEPAPEPQTS